MSVPREFLQDRLRDASRTSLLPVSPVVVPSADGGLWLQRNGTRGITWTASQGRRVGLSLLRGPASIDATAARGAAPGRPRSGRRSIAARPPAQPARAPAASCSRAQSPRRAACSGRTPAAAAGASAAPRGPRWRRHLCRRRGRRRGRHRGAARRKYARRTAAWRRAASRRGSSRAGGRRAERVPSLRTTVCC